MPSPTNNSGLRDNHTRGTVADFLRAKIQSNSNLSIVSAYFTIYAYDALKEVLDRNYRDDNSYEDPFSAGLRVYFQSSAQKLVPAPSAIDRYVEYRIAEGHRPHSFYYLKTFWREAFRDNFLR